MQLCYLVKLQNGYCGVWKYHKPNPSIGWFCSPFVTGEYDRRHPSVTTNEHTIGKRMFLCEIIIKPLKDKKGRPITKIIK